MSEMIKTSDGWKQTSGNVDYSEIDALKSSLAKLETYDSNEQIIGETYDGKKIYRRIFTTVLTNSIPANTWTPIINIGFAPQNYLKVVLLRSDGYSSYPSQVGPAAGNNMQVNVPIALNNVNRVLVEYIKY